MSSFSLTFDNGLLVIRVAAVLIAFGGLPGYPVFVLVGNSIIEPRGLVRPPAGLDHACPPGVNAGSLTLCAVSIAS